MPNLDHDPQNPTDLLGQPIAEGDIVAWGTTFGRSAALCVAEIEKIRFTRKVNYENAECAQADAEDYQLRLRPIKSTGSVTGSKFHHVRDGVSYHEPIIPKGKLITLVKNVVKLSGQSVALATDIALEQERAVREWTGPTA